MDHAHEEPRPGPRLLFVPGFTQTPSSWDGVTAQLSPGVDWSVLEVPDGPSFEVVAGRLADAGGRAIWVGYSMGGRLALRVALDRPGLVDGLVLVSATPGIASASERAARVEHDEQLAGDALADGVDAFLERWLAQPMFATVPPDAPGLDDRRRLSPDTIARQLRILGTGVMEPMWDALASVDRPVLVVTGRRDAKFDAIGARIAATVAGARHERVDAGHAIPLERPADLARLVEAFRAEIAAHRAP